MNIDRVRQALNLHGLGMLIAEADDRTQAELLNEIGRGFKQIMNEPRGQEMQICYLSDHLSTDGEDFILAIAGFIELKRKAS